MTIFPMTQQFADESCSSSNLDEISMGQSCVQNFILIRLPFPELSCKRPDTLIDSRVYSLFQDTMRKKTFGLSPTLICTRTSERLREQIGFAQTVEKHCHTQE